MAGETQVLELKTGRTTVKRKGFRGKYDFETIAAILDEGFVCHVGFVVDGQPYVIPTGYGRKGRTIYIHGLSVNHMLNSLAEGVSLCFTVTLADGFVFARSGFNHSINYRSVVVLGTAVEVAGDEKLAALETIVNHILPGRWPDTRPPNAIELKATSVLKIDITEASAKIRSGPPIDDEEDLGLRHWAGVVPLTTVPGNPIPDAKLVPGVPVPTYVTDYRRPGWKH